MTDCVAVKTQMESLTVSNLDFPKLNSPEWDHMQTVPYRECVGRLSFSVVSRYLHNPGIKHWNLASGYF